MTLEKCPTCGGHKTISKPPWVAGDVNVWCDNGTASYTCPTCDGKGYLRTTDEELIRQKMKTISLTSVCGICDYVDCEEECGLDVKKHQTYTHPTLATVGAKSDRRGTEK